MSFKDFDKKTFIIDTARDFAARRISKRDFLRKTGMAGIGLSAFASGLLGNTRPFRGNLGGNAAYAQTPDEMTKWPGRLRNGQFPGQTAGRGPRPL